MQKLDCSSLDNSNADFDQLSTVIGEVRNYFRTFGAHRDPIRVYSFEIPRQLMTPLENLNVLFRKLAQDGRLTDAQINILTHCERGLARFYCWIRYFVDLYLERCRAEPTVDQTQQARHMTHEFYFYAMYELRTYFTVILGYLQTPLLESESARRTDFLNQVYSSQPILENREIVEQINYWIEELRKFVDDLPRLRDESEYAA